MSDVCRFIHEGKADYTIVLLCRVMMAARSGYYAWHTGIKAREERRRGDEALAHEITVIHVASKRTYGVPRVTAELRRHGQLVNHKRVERVMRERGIVGHTRRTGRRGMTQQDHKAAPAPDLVGRDFHAGLPGMKIVGDVTCIPTAGAGSTSPAGSIWRRARSSATRWPTTIALNWSSTPSTWPRTSAVRDRAA
ncbi:IS3 family transposase [Streptomyces sp. ITFR-6]|uniref:IS3 family transposase n=1 Tax=Streptomyces sp. ITFR-6 TaxID=3075197 RepID=UPI002889C62A|nr:IS3 family transposase [Streptomyces sp. ITFR-6]WNI27773.1 IS3 family transposase [Streptomyces sp. ITFR-6]